MNIKQRRVCVIILIFITCFYIGLILYSKVYIFSIFLIYMFYYIYKNRAELFEVAKLN